MKMEIDNHDLIAQPTLAWRPGLESLTDRDIPPSRLVIALL